MKRAFVDTSAWFAYANRHDPDHAAVAAVLRRRDLRFVTSNFVFDETVTLTRRLGHGAARTVGDTLRNPAAVEMVRASHDDEEAAWALHGARPDKARSYTNCVSFEIMHRLGLTVAVSLDDDFAQAGFDVLP